MMRSAAAVATFVLVLLAGGAALYLWADKAAPGRSAAVPLGVAAALLLGLYTRLRPAATTVPEDEFVPPPPVIPTHPRVPPRPRPSVSLPRRADRLTALIDEVKKRLGDPPRAFDRRLAAYLRADPPLWSKPDQHPELTATYARQDEIRARGRVVWAGVVQANATLFAPGAFDHAAAAVHSPDPWYDARPDALAAVARALGELKQAIPDDPGTAAVVRALIDEAWTARLPVPRRLAGGRAVYLSSVVLVRKHLPAGHLSGGFLPVWVDPARDGSLMPVPAAYWPAELLARWADE